MELTVYGTGCSKCAELERLTRETAARIDPAIQVEKVHDLKAMLAAGIMSAPALAIDGQIMCAGRAPSAREIEDWIRTAQG